MSFSALFTGATGLIAHGQWTQVIGNDMANVNTTGYKGQSVVFENLLSEDLPGGGDENSGQVSQIGMGSRVASVLTDFQQGTVSPGHDATDMAISGKGFFVVEDQASKELYYTRAGLFRFDKDGWLKDPHGNVVQGWSVPPSASGSAADYTAGQMGDIRLENFKIMPKPTQRVDMMTNLDAGQADEATSDKDPFFAMFSRWNGQESVPIGQSQYTYTTTINVNDDTGTSHPLTIYYDPVAVETPGGKKAWEFMVTTNPGDDGRVFGGQDVSKTGAAGVLMTGTMTFTAAGTLDGITAYTLQGDSGDPKDLANWKLADISRNGLPTTSFQFMGATAANNIELNLGMVLGEPSADSKLTVGSWTSPAGTSAADVGTSYSNLAGQTLKTVDAMASTNYSAGSVTLYQYQDGYKEGDLQNLSVDSDGALVGYYTNGQNQRLFYVGMADFRSENGLRREGNNLYSATKESGKATYGSAGTGALGSITSKTLEQSNVEIGRGMVDLVIAQRGFQANSKIIGTTDTLLQEAIQMKK